MDPVTLRAKVDRQLREAVHPTHGGRLERVGRVVRYTSAAPGGWNGIEWSDVDSATADQVIAEQVEFFRGRGFEWKYYSHDKPADLPDRLRAAGLTPGPVEALMVAEAAAVLADPRPPARIEIRAATSPADLRLVQQVHDDVFGEDHTGLIEDLRERLRERPETVTPVLAMAGDRPVSSSRVEFHVGTEFASLWGGGTLPDWRGRGIYRATVAYRARLAAERGYRYLRTDALPPSRPVLERLGFIQLGTTIPFTPPE